MKQRNTIYCVLKNNKHYIQFSHNKEYLKENPSVRDAKWELAVVQTHDVAIIEVVDTDVCLAVEQQRNSDVLAVPGAPAAVGDINAFGCVADDLGTGATGFTAYYKL